MDKPTRNELAVTDRVFAGHLTGIPDIKSNKVLVYLSAGITDMQAERNWIMRNGVPQLRSFCRENGLEFQIVDMRWGIKDEVTDNHENIALCLQDIQKCQTISVGPNFVSLLGDKYGYRPLVAEIEATEFKLIKNTAIEHGYDISLLTTWYECDHNREPIMYVLQPISTEFPSFFDNSPINIHLQQQAQREWWSVVDTLQQMFRKVSNFLYKSGKITEEAKQKYFQSTLEAEVRAGIINAGDMSSKALCFQRTLNEINIKNAVNTLERFVDLTEKNMEKHFDYEAEKLREQLRLEKVKMSMPKQNLYRYNLQWDTHGLNVAGNPQHKRYLWKYTFIDTFSLPPISYLEAFGQDFLSSMKNMILSGIVELSVMYGNSYLLEEVIHHLQLCKTLCHTFCGRETVLDEIRQKINKENERKLTSKNEKYKAFNFNKYENGDDKETVIMSDFLEWQTVSFSDSKSLDTHLSNYDDEESTKKTILSEKSDLGQHQNAQFDLEKDLLDATSDSSYDDELVQKLMAETEEFSTPLVIYGQSGNGQTALSAKLMELSKVWFPECISVVRFIGTSHISSKIRELILSICWQISHAYKIPGPNGADLSVDFQSLTDYFKTLLWRINTTTVPLVIILDSVDHLSTSDHAHEFYWLPQKLPLNVHFIVSIVSDRLDFLKNLRSIYHENDRYFEIIRLEKKDATDIITQCCKKAGRHLVKKQRTVLIEKFEQCDQTLYLKTLVNKAIYWKNSDDIKKEDIGSNDSEVINQLFDKLEAEHSQGLVKQSLSYLCASRGGLTDVEIEDLLSLDNAVLQDIYVYYLPSDPDVVRVPTFLLKRLWTDLHNYFVETKSGSHRVINWFHRRVKEIATTRYLVPQSVKQVHETMADYFLGVWSSKPKPLNLTKGRKGYYPNAYRQVPAQPTVFSPSVYNTRMLHCLSFHLIYSARFEILFDLLLTDPNWLYAKCVTLTITALLEDLKLTETKLAKHIHVLTENVNALEGIISGSRRKDELSKFKQSLSKHLGIFEELKFLIKMILQSSESIRRDPIYLPIQIIAMLGPTYKGMEHIEKLLHRCLDWCSGIDVPLLLPLTECLVKPEPHLLFTISLKSKEPLDEEQAMMRNQSICLQEETNRLYAVQHLTNRPDEICIFDLEDYGSCVTVMGFNTYIQSLTLASNNKYFLVEECVQDAVINISTDTKVYKTLNSKPIQLPNRPDVISTSRSGKYLAYSAGGAVHVCLCKKAFPPYFTFEEHRNPVNCLQISPDDSLLLSAEVKTRDKMPFIRSLMFDLESKSMLRELDSKLLVTKDSLISSDNVLICTKVVDQGTVVLYDLKNGVILNEVRIHEQFAITVLQLHESHKFVLCGMKGLPKEADNVDNATGSKVKVVKLSDGAMYGDCTFTSTLSCLKVFGTDQIYFAVSEWKKPVVSIYFAGETEAPLEKGFLVHRIQGHERPVHTILIPSMMDTIITVSFDNTIKVWDLKMTLNNYHSELSTIENRLARASRLEPTLEQVVSQYRHIDNSKHTRTTTLCLNKYGDSLYVGTYDGRLQRYCTDTGVLKMTRQTTVEAIDILLLSRSGQYVIAIGDKVHVEDLQADRQMIFVPPYNVSRAVEANSILVCASTGIESLARVWDIRTGQLLCDISRPYTFRHTIINSTGTKIISLTNGKPCVFTLNGKTAKHDISSDCGNNLDEPTCSVISPDDSLTAFGGEDGLVKVINVKGETVHILNQGSKVITLTFTPDCKSLMTAGYKSIHVWSCRTGEQRYKLSRHMDFITHLKFDKTGQFFVSFSDDNQLILWDYHKSISMATFYTQTAIHGLDVADRADTIAYVPKGVMDVAILKPNAALRGVMSGSVNTVTLEPKAQALALAFSNQSATSSTVCNVM